VESDAHRDRGSARPVLRPQRPLRVAGGLDGRLRRGEDGEELVGAALDLAPSVLRDGPAQERPRPREDVAVLLAELANEPGRLLDVGEEEGELVLGRLRHVLRIKDRAREFQAGTRTPGCG
jgi:hypothetical protein